MTAPQPSGEPTCLLVAGAFLLAEVTLGEQGLDEVVDSLLLALLTADKDGSRVTDTQKWLPAFDAVLGNLGWLFGAAQTTEFTAGSAGRHLHPQPIEPLDHVAAKLREALPTETVDAVTARLLALRDNSEAANRWRENTLAGKNAGSVICVATRTGQSSTLVVNYNTMTAADEITDYPWASDASPGLKLTQTQVVATLNENVFGPARAAIAAKTAARRISDVVPLT